MNGISDPDWSEFLPLVVYVVPAHFQARRGWDSRLWKSTLSDLVITGNGILGCSDYELQLGSFWRNDCVAGAGQRLPAVIPFVDLQGSLACGQGCLASGERPQRISGGYRVEVAGEQRAKHLFDLFSWKVVEFRRKVTGNDREILGVFGERAGEFIPGGFPVQSIVTYPFVCFPLLHQQLSGSGQINTG